MTHLDLIYPNGRRIYTQSMYVDPWRRRNGTLGWATPESEHVVECIAQTLGMGEGLSGTPNRRPKCAVIDKHDQGHT